MNRIKDSIAAHRSPAEQALRSRQAELIAIRETMTVESGYAALMAVQGQIEAINYEIEAL